MGDKTLKVTMTEKKKKSSRFPSFLFWPITEIENLETSESFRLLQFLLV